MDGGARKDAQARPGPDFWRTVPIFRELSDAVLTELSAISLHQRWPAGTVLFQRGDPSTWLVAVEKGRIKLSLQTPGGREFALRQAGAGTIFGEIGVLDGGPRSADAVAVQASAGYLVDRIQFLRLMAVHGEFALAVTRHMCALLRYSTEHIESIALFDLESRLARFLLAAARGNDDEAFEPGGRLELDLNQSDIADLLGASRSKVNRAIAALEAAGAISRRGRTITWHPARLARAANPDGN